MAIKRIEVTQSALSTAEQANVFRLLIDGSTWPSWSPISSFRLAAESDDGAEGVGAVRVFKTGLLSSHEETVRIDAPNVFGYKLLTRALHVRDYRAEVTLTPQSGGTSITWAGSFRPLFPGSGWIWKRIIERLYRQFSEGLAAHADQLGSDDSPKDESD